MLIMCISVFVFTASSYNLFVMLSENFRFLAEHGAMAIMHGGLLQLVQLLGYCLISATAYIIFRACEHVLIDWLLE